MDMPIDIPIWAWLGFNALVLVLLALDLGVLNKKERTITVPQALRLSAFYVAIALLFNTGIYFTLGEAKALEFLTGYLIEKSLSLDNVFVIALIFGSLAVPPQYQHRVLFWGILGALVMRAIMIFAGTALIMELHWLIYLFGGFLIITGIKMVISADKEPDPANHPIIRFCRKHFRVTENYEGRAFFVRRNKLLYITPLFLALILVEFTDLVFAVDSIPAIFAITTDPFIVYTSNVFAILGLRALYFALAGIIHRFEYLKYGLALVLVLVGTKMVLVDVWKMPTPLALGLTVSLIGGSILLSLWKTRGEAHGKA